MTRRPINRATGNPEKPITIGERAPATAGRIAIDAVAELLPELIDSIADAVLVVDRQRRVVAANRRYLEAFGTRGDQIVGELCHSVVDCPEMRSGHPCAACQAETTREPHRMVRVLPDASGQMRRWEATLNPVLDARGEVGHIVEVWRDITERTQLEGQLAHGERLASLGVLAAGVAHELNNPLASMLLGVDSLRRWLDRTPGVSPDAAAEAREVIDLVDQQIRRSKETTDKLMLLAQPVQVKPGWMDVNQAMRDTVSLLRYQTRAQRVEVSEDLAADLPPIWARASGIRGVLMNVCMNAVQAMREGGRLTVRTARDDDAHVRIEIADTGPGIAPEHLERIWAPFFTTKPVGSGTGLGLSISRRVVESHGGTIAVDSRPGDGARFVVTLPLHGPGGEHV